MQSITLQTSIFKGKLFDALMKVVVALEEAVNVSEDFSQAHHDRMRIHPWYPFKGHGLRDNYLKEFGWALHIDCFLHRYGIDDESDKFGAAVETDLYINIGKSDFLAMIPELDLKHRGSDLDSVAKWLASSILEHFCSQEPSTK